MSGHLVDPSGRVIEARRDEDWPPEFMKMLAAFALACADTSLGIVCLRCRQPLVGANATQDTAWKMECSCRTYRGRNPMREAGRRIN